MRSMMTIPAAAACLLMAGAAFAQTPAQSTPQANPTTAPAAPAAAAPAPAAPTANFTDDELKKFIPLATQVKTIMDQHQPAITAATDPTAKVKEQNAMSGELQVAVTDAGLTVQRYNEIAQAMRSDPTLVARMQQLAAAAQPASTATQ